MQITNPLALRALRGEAERQADYWRTRGSDVLMLMWQSIADMAQSSIRNGSPLIIEGNLEIPIPIIKGGEQVQQPHTSL